MGKYTYQYEGFSYDGEWEDGLKHGQGKMKLPDGSVYEGDFLHGEMLGRGRRTWSDGSFYDGDVVRGEKHGRGTMQYPSGDRYCGDWDQQRRAIPATAESSSQRLEHSSEKSKANNSIPD